MSTAAPKEALHLAPMMSVLPPNVRMLVEAGGGDGALARRYKKSYPAVFYQSVDKLPERAAQARQYADTVHVADLDTASDGFFRHFAMADCWIFNTTLETLADPLRVLERVRASLPIDACLVARIANRQHWRWREGGSPAMTMAAILPLFAQARLGIVTGAALSEMQMPPVIETGLREAAIQAGADPETAIQDAWPTHFLIKAIPA